MHLVDFEIHDIRDFKPYEVTRVGSKLAQIQLKLMVQAQMMRDVLGRRVRIICLTRGKHKPKSYHYDGRAMDFVLYVEDGAISISDVFKAAIKAGFCGVGIYWNGVAWSFHVDTRPEYGFWCAYKKQLSKKRRATTWTYIALTLDADYLKERQGLPLAA